MAALADDRCDMDVAEGTSFARASAVSEAMDDAEEQVREIVSELISKLVVMEAFRVHRAFSASTERRELEAQAAKACIAVVRANGWVDLPVSR